MAEPKCLFILIGIDHYAKGDKLLNKDGARCRLRPLRGAVNDVRRFQDYISQSPRLKDSKVWVLTSSRPKTGRASDPPEAPEQQPTYDNIVRVFGEAAEEVTKIGGGIVHIHFSCHGIQMKTNYPELKSAEGIDEAIAPWDACRTGQPLRDVELSILIWRMTKNGARVSLFCDCCHASSVPRGMHISKNVLSEQILTMK